MVTNYRFTLNPDWRSAPLAFWVHVPLDGSAQFVPAAPVPVLHKGYVFLHIEAANEELQFSSLAQLDHFIAVMQTIPLPTSRQLSNQRALAVGPNGHWLSRLPAKLKAPRERAKLVGKLRAVRDELAPLNGAWHSHPLLF